MLGCASGGETPYKLDAKSTPVAAIALQDLEKYYPPPGSGLRAYLQPFERATRPALKGLTFGYHAGSDQGFYPRRTGRQNLLSFVQLNHLSNSDAHRRIAELAETFHLREALDRQMCTLSTGTTQRLSLARALLHRPAVLLLDEPTRSLDAIAAAELLKQI